MAEKEYQRLTWSRRRPGIAVLTVSRASLWLGTDHLLYIETNGYTENYKRFYFRDIQSITVQRTNDRMVWGIVFAGLGALLLIIGFATRDTAAIITFAVLTMIFCVVPLLINLAMGPTCKCQVRTAVQTEDLPISRVPRARKLLEKLRPLVAATQGQMTAEEIPGRMQQLAAATAAALQPGLGAATGVPHAIDDPNAPPRIVS